MGVTYQTTNRQRRKVMTAPLNAPPEELVETTPAIADAPALEPVSPPSRLGSLLATLTGVAAAAAVMRYFL